MKQGELNYIDVVKDYENRQVVQVTKYGHEHGVRCGKTVEEAVENYNKEAVNYEIEAA
jgi:uncharacterized protein YunC (DUF1805 family)